MSLRFLSDQCVPLSISDILRQYGHDVTLLRDVLPIRSPDPVVIAKSLELDRVLVSLNGDFADIVSYPPRDYRGIIALQLHNHPEIIPQLMDRLTTFLAAEPDQASYLGKLFIVEVHRIRIRQ